MRGPDPAGEAEHDPRAPHVDRPHRAFRPRARDRSRPGRTGAAVAPVGHGGAGYRRLERAGRPAPWPRLPAPVRPAPALVRSRQVRPTSRLPAVRGGGEVAARPRRVGRMEREGPRPAVASGGVEQPVPDLPLGPGGQSRLEGPVHGGASASRRVAAAPWMPAGVVCARRSWIRAVSTAPATEPPTGP